MRFFHWNVHNRIGSCLILGPYLLASTPVTTRTETLDLDRSAEHLTSERQLSYPVPTERTKELGEKYSIQTSRSFPIYNAQNAINSQNIKLENENIRQFERNHTFQQMSCNRSEDSLQMDSFKFVLKTQLEIENVKLGAGDDNCDSDLKARPSAIKNTKKAMNKNTLETLTGNMTRASTLSNDKNIFISQSETISAN